MPVIFADPRYEIASDDSHAKVFAEVNIDGYHQLIITLEDESVGPVFEFHSPQSKVPVMVRCRDLLSVIEKAIARLETK